jgi:diamine N-acetyltransferase
MQIDEKITLEEVSTENWRDIIALDVKSEQAQYVASSSFYLLLCHYDQIWHPKAIVKNQEVIGVIMWAIDPDDESGWIGGFLIDQKWQKKGYGKLALLEMLSFLKHEQQRKHVALSVQPQNPAIHLYESIGFTKTDEWEGDEIVMRFSMD